MSKKTPEKPPQLDLDFNPKKPPEEPEENDSNIPAFGDEPFRKGPLTKKEKERLKNNEKPSEPKQGTGDKSEPDKPEREPYPSEIRKQNAANAKDKAIQEVREALKEVGVDYDAEDGNKK